MRDSTAQLKPNFIEKYLSSSSLLLLLLFYIDKSVL